MKQKDIKKRTKTQQKPNDQLKKVKSMSLNLVYWFKIMTKLFT